MSKKEVAMLQQSDVVGRLRLFRYGLIVVGVVTFLVSLLAPWAAFRNIDIPEASKPAITDFLGTALLYTVIVTIVLVIVYFAYAEFLKRTVKSV
jgi:hypothetical protein